MGVRGQLNRGRVLEAAAAVADAGGLDSVSMRAVAREAGVEAMSLYHHVANKEALLDGLAAWAVAQINLPQLHDPWRGAMQLRCASARTVLAAHPWAIGLIDSRRRPDPVVLRHHDTVLGNLRTNGFSVELAGHAFSALDSYVFGFVITEVNLPMQPGADTEAFSASVGALLDPYPHLGELLTHRVRGHAYAYSDEFDDGLTMILDALQHRLETET